MLKLFCIGTNVTDSNQDVIFTGTRYYSVLAECTYWTTRLAQRKVLTSLLF